MQNEKGIFRDAVGLKKKKEEEEEEVHLDNQCRNTNTRQNQKPATWCRDLHGWLSPSAFPAISLGFTFWGEIFA